MARVALVLVSHSAAAAEGAADIAREMAPDVLVVAAGGADGRLGTSPDRVREAVEECAGRTAGDAGGGVVVLTDLGSAILTAETVLELVDDDVATRVRIPSAPFVEGAVAAAVEAQQGGDLAAVEAAAVASASVLAGGPQPDGRIEPAGPRPDVPDEVVSTAVLRNPLGLHARPAAVVARAVAATGVEMTIDGVNGASVLQLMQLGATQGRELTVAARGPGAREAVDQVAALLGSGFGEE